MHQQEKVRDQGWKEAFVHLDPFLLEFTQVEDSSGENRAKGRFGAEILL